MAYWGNSNIVAIFMKQLLNTVILKTYKHVYEIQDTSFHVIDIIAVVCE